MLEFADGRPWLARVRIDAATAIVQDLARYTDADPADLHEDVRETLIPFFDKLDALVERHAQLRAAVTHVVDDSPGTPDSVKNYLRKALGGQRA